MASLSELLGKSAKAWAAKNIAKKDAAQRKKEGFLGGLLSLLKPVAGFGSKALMAAAGIGSGGVLSPLLLGLGTTGFSKLFDVVGRDVLKLGADPSKITATGKYGYGKEAAKTLSEGLAKSIKDRNPLSGENVLADVIGSYVSALTPKLGVDPKTGEMGVEGGELGQDVMDTLKGKHGSKLSMLDLNPKKGIGKALLPTMAETELSPFAEQMAQDPSKALSSYYQDVMEDVPLSEGLSETDYLSQILKAETPAPMLFPSTAPALGSNLGWREASSRGEIPQLDEFGSWGAHVGMSPQEVAAKRGQMSQFTQSLNESPTDWESYYQSLPSPVEEFDPYEMQQGGQVSKYYGGGSVSGGSPTIAGYFNQQGKTMGGSNTQSLTEMLGRK